MARKKTQIVAVTPFGRKATASILFMYLHKLHKQKDLDKWVLLMNTNVSEDLAYGQQLAAEYDWIDLNTRDTSIRLQPHDNGIHHFWQDLREDNTIYVRFDDDIVWLDTIRFKEYIKYVRNSDALFNFALVWNNAIASHILQRAGKLDLAQGIAEWACMDDAGWRDPKFALNVHETFLANGYVKDLPKEHVLFFHDRYSINTASWKGESLQDDLFPWSWDEEQYACVDAPKKLDKYNVVFQPFQVVHYAFHVQKEYLDTTDILQQYQELAEKEVGND